jgi:peptidoglycan/LPS O-acetylase OafA/YrhL
MAGLGWFRGVANIRRDVLGALFQVFNWVKLASGESYADLTTLNSGFRKPLEHYWSLAIEEQFYWVWPFVLHRLSVWQVVSMCLGVAAAWLVIRVEMLAAGADKGAIYTFSVCRMDALSLGGAAAAWMRLPGALRWIGANRKPLLTGMLALTIGGFIATQGYGRAASMTQGVGYSVLALVFVLLITLAAQADLTGVHGWVIALRAIPLRVLGKYSYGMYIFHWPLHELLGRRILLALDIKGGFGVAASIVYIFLCGIFSLILALFSYHIFEVQFLSLKSRFDALP